MKFITTALVATALLSPLANQARAELVLTMGGDMNFTSSRQAPPDDPKTGKVYSWAERYSGIAPLWNGDVNYANIETVISDQTDLREANSPQGNQRTFVFRSSPQGLSYGLSKGLNLLSVANNHAGDYGKTGMLETQFHIEMLKNDFPNFVASGLAATDKEKGTPQILTVQTEDGPVRVAFIAMTGVMGPTERVEGSDTSFGVLSFYNEEDFTLAMRGLREAKADIRVLSVHWGTEGVLEVQSKQKEWGHRALKEGNLDLIIGSHPHRVHPIERVDGRVIYYSLGNYLMRGAKNLNSFPAGHDYGLFSRIYFNYDSSAHRWMAQAIEAVPLTDLNAISHPMASPKAQDRIQLLGRISQQQFPQTGVHFTPSKNGGVACFGSNLGKRAEKICP